jgi:5-methylcytosine-specific restriction endonuclease McrA
MPVNKRTRFEVFKRDNHTCRYCGGTAPDVVLTVFRYMCGVVWNKVERMHEGAKAISEVRD